MAVRGSRTVSAVEMMYFSGSGTISPPSTSVGPNVKLCTTPLSR